LNFSWREIGGGTCTGRKGKKGGGRAGCSSPVSNWVMMGGQGEGFLEGGRGFGRLNWVEGQSLVSVGVGRRRETLGLGC